MNFAVLDLSLGRQRCRQWSPLITQQLRFRHLYQILAYNLISSEGGSFYYTLHLTPMCAPFYTSEKIDSLNPKWAELDMKNVTLPSISAFVLRIWQVNETETDKIILTWGINLSGLVYLGSKLSEIQSESFNGNSVIFYLRGGFFTSYSVLRTDLQKPLPFIDSLNLVSTEDSTKIYRNAIIKWPKSEVKNSYALNKLQKLHSLQILIKNKSSDVAILREKLNFKCGLCGSGDASAAVPSSSRHTSHLLTMTSLNRMLQDKPTQFQKEEAAKISRRLETAKFRTKLLSHEKDRKSVHIRQLKQKLANLMDENEEKESQLMDNYRQLNKDSERFKEWKKDHFQLKEQLVSTQTQLCQRSRQLMLQLLSIYPITQQDVKFMINGTYLPNSEILGDCSDDGLAVALGSVSHILNMSSAFLQVPLRYPITHMGSRSLITDHITSTLTDRDRDFPLFTKGKDRMQFNYAIYLLNKNIAQLRWLCGLNTPDLRATLSNLLSFLQGRGLKNDFPLPKPETTNENDTKAKAELQSCLERNHYFGPCSSGSDPILNSLRHKFQEERSQSPTSRVKKIKKAPGPGLSQILAIPEAYMNQEMSPDSFKSYMTSENYKLIKKNGRTVETPNQGPDKNCDIKDIKIYASTDILNDSTSLGYVEQGTDTLDDRLSLQNSESRLADEKFSKQSKRLSRSVESFNEDATLDVRNSSDPSLNRKSPQLPDSLEDGQHEFLQKWLNSDPALVCSDENLNFGEGSELDQPLTTRTNALLNTKSFNMIKPK